MTSALDALRALQGQDLPVQGGRTLAYVYDSGLDEVDLLGREAVALYAGSNGLDPTAFPSLLAMENDLDGFAARLLDAPSTVVGSVTSGGTESVLLAVQTARDAYPTIESPEMVLPDTAHAAFHKAAHYFGVRPVIVPVGTDFRADASAMAAAVGPRTVLVVGSAPSYAHGVVDPIPALAATAARAGVRCHVDACIGGWVLPYATRLGRSVPPWTFAVEGVTSMSVDTHKYAYAPKGTSLLLHREAALRAPQFFSSAQWPGYTMLNSTMQSTRSGGPVAGAWAVVRHLGDEGYLAVARDVFAAVDQLVAGIAAQPGLSLLARPDSTLLAVTTDASCDPFTICDEMKLRGWYVQPQMTYAHSATLTTPANLHLSVSAATLAHVDDFLSALADSVSTAQNAGPVQVDADVVAFIEALDPVALSDADFDGLLSASGLVTAGGADLALPEAMADVNALLDVAAPAMREALLKAFLDRLSRPASGLL